MSFFFMFQIREGRTQGVGSCLVREYRIVCHVLRGKFNLDILEVEYASFSHPFYRITRLTLDFYCRDSEPYSSTRIEILRCVISI